MGNWDGGCYGGVEMGNRDGSGYGGAGVYVDGSGYAYDAVNCHCSGSASFVVKTVNQGNLGVYRVIGVVVFSWKGDHGMRVWMYGCGNGGGHDRSCCVGDDVVMSGDCALIPCRETAFQPMRHQLNWRLKHGLRNPANSQKDLSHRTRSLGYSLVY